MFLKAPLLNKDECFVGAFNTKKKKSFAFDLKTP